MKHFAVIVCLWCLLPHAIGQVYSADPGATRSTSGQFVVYPLLRANPLPPSLSNATNLVRLEPNFLAVSCERIKQALLTELGAANAWRGKIYLVLRPVQSVDDRIVINATQFTDGWMYQVDLPDAVEAPRLVGTIVQVLLLEMANRNAGARTAELPIWLAEGISQEMMAASEIDLVLHPPQQTINSVSISQKLRNARKKDPLAVAHERLRARSPLTIEQLSWPTEEQLSGLAGEVYSSSAQLFVHELLRLKNGRAGLRTMVEQLSQDYNWQTTFLRAFRAHFKRQLDLEKWWALQLVHFTGRDLMQTWRGEESWKKLDEIVRPPVQVRVSTNELPLHAEVSLQTIVREWDYPSQQRVLRDKIIQLQLLRLRMAHDFTHLVDDYCQTLEAYLQKRDKADPTLKPKKRNRPDIDQLVQETVSQLGLADAQREASRPQKIPFAAADPKDRNAPLTADLH